MKTSNRGRCVRTEKGGAAREEEGCPQDLS